jgi:Family of unknown function (DUF6298)
VNWSLTLYALLFGTYCWGAQTVATGGSEGKLLAPDQRVPLRPLRVDPNNPRYFTDGTKLPDGSWKAVYLTGSHTWANLIDRGTSDPPPVFNFDGYLDLLQRHNHNFIRLWNRHVSWYENYGEQQLHAAPLAWQRTGPGQAIDGKPKFDLSKFDPAYFERLRSRVKAAGDRGIYVSVMLFGGHAETVANWTGCPLHRDNNINGADGDPNQDGSGREVETLAEIPRDVAEFQKEYVRNVVDVLNDLDNVLFEISNEGGPTSKDWQYAMIDFVRSYERTKRKQHPVGMTAGFWPAKQNRGILQASPADWVSYLFEMQPKKGLEAFSPSDPFIADGRKVSIQDSDHWWVVPIYGDAAFGRAWVWKSFCRGHNPILMEHLPPRSFVAGDHPLTAEDAGYMASRTAMGHTRRYAERINLGATKPSTKIASTGYCLVNAGHEYLIFLPSGGTVTVDLSAAEHQLEIEWFNPAEDKTIESGTVRGGSTKIFKSPFSGDSVLYLAAPR